MKKILLLMALVLVFQAGHGVHAATYYIATTGSDFSGDGSSTNPWATINHALSKINAGDAIMVQPGTYPQSTYININDPVRHANITITGTPVDRPVIQGNPDQFSTVVIRPGVRGVTLSYLKINGGPSRKTDPSVGGVLIQVRDNPTTIQHCEIYNGYTAVSIDSSKNIDIGYNTIHTFGKINADLEDPRTWANSKGTGIGIYNYQSWGPASGWHEKIYIHHNKVFDIAEDAVLNFKAEYEYIEIAYNNFHDNYEDGIDLKTGRYYRIHHNKLHHNYGAGLVTHSGAALSYDRGADDVEFYANEVYENKNFGIFMKWGPEPATNWKIYNNLFYKNCQNPADWGVGLMLSGGGHEVYNNTFYDNTVPPTAKYPDSWCAGFWE
jgi:hypothetical protein